MFKSCGRKTLRNLCYTNLCNTSYPNRMGLTSLTSPIDQRFPTNDPDRWRYMRS